MDVDYLLGGARFCTVDKDTIKPDYKGQTMYVTYATKLDSSKKYSGRISLNGESKTEDFKNPSNLSGPGSLYLSLPMREPGTYKVEFLEDGKVVKEKSVEVESAD